MCHPCRVGYYTVNPIMWALAISLATFAGWWTYLSYRRRNYRSALRGAALVLLPFGLLFTGTLTLLLRFIDATTLWASRLIFSPMVWVGVILVVVAVVLFVAAGRAPDRSGAEPRGRRSRQAVADGAGPALPKGRAADPVDADMAEIEAILRKRGIT